MDIIDINYHKKWKIVALVSGLILLLVVVIFVIRISLVYNLNSEVSDRNINILEPIDTSHITNSVEKVEVIIPEKKQIDEVKLLAVGDMMLDRSVFLHTREADDFYFPFEKIGDFLLDADITLGNLEGAITTNKSIANGIGGQRFYFTFSPQFVDPLTTYFDVVSYANNHALNFGIDGLMQSRQFLDESGLKYFGSPTNDQNNISIILEKNNITIGLVGYHQLIGYGFDNVIDEIEKLRPDVDVLIAYPHWGAEYTTTNPTYQTRQEAYAMIDAGVDIILGSHPHVIQPIEIYNNKVIFYSLGNFIFDQYFSLETMQGLAVDIKLTKEDDKILSEYKLIPIHINTSSQPYVIEDIAERDAIFDHMSAYSVVTSTMRDQIKEGHLTL